VKTAQSYRGRIAPSPTGYLHLGHAATFWTAFERAREQQGTLVFRNEDLDPQRCRPEFARAMIEDLRWYGIEWQEGPDVGGEFGPYVQSERRAWYLDAWRKLRDGGWVYPCICSRKELALVAGAPHDEDDEPLYPGTCRERSHLSREIGDEGGALETGNASLPAAGALGNASLPAAGALGNASLPAAGALGNASLPVAGALVNWRFRVPDGERIEFHDLRMGRQSFVAGRDFGDFLVWRRDDVPAYQLAVVVDDAAMRISEVVRGADLLRSTARQILLQRALGLATPEYFHCPLMTDEHGKRLAKRHDALSLRRLREQGMTPEQVRAMASHPGSEDFLPRPAKK
jgi:glutamyl/glutaminyl-tRNA synthetase